MANLRFLIFIVVLLPIFLASHAAAETQDEPRGSATIAWEFHVHNPNDISPAGISIFLRPGGGVLAVDGSGFLYAVNAGGQLIKDAALPSGDYFTAPDLNSAGRIVVGSSAGTVSCYDKDANVLWNIETRSVSGRDKDATAAFGVDGQVYVAEGSGDVSVWDATGGLVRRFATPITFAPGPQYFEPGSLLVTGNSIFAVSDDEQNSDCRIHCLDMQGKESWSWQVPSGILYGLDCAPDGTVYVLSHKDKFYALNPDGGERWSWANPEPLEDSRFHFIWFTMSPDGNAFLSSDYLFVGLTPDGKELIRTHYDGECWTPIIGPAGTVYVKTRRPTGERVDNEPVTEDVLHLAYGAAPASWSIPSGLITFAGPGADGEFYCVHLNRDVENPVTICRIDLRK